MSLEAICRIDAIVDNKTLSEIVSNDINIINNKLLEMGIENTTGLEPSNDKQFKIQMRKKHKKLKDIAFTDLVKDTETEELYYLVKESDYNIKSMIRKVRATRRLKNKDKMQDIIQ